MYDRSDYKPTVPSGVKLTEAQLNAYTMLFRSRVDNNTHQRRLDSKGDSVRFGEVISDGIRKPTWDKLVEFGLVVKCHYVWYNQYADYDRQTGEWVGANQTCSYYRLADIDQLTDAIIEQAWVGALASVKLQAKQDMLTELAAERKEMICKMYGLLPEQSLVYAYVGRYDADGELNDRIQYQFKIGIVEVRSNSDEEDYNYFQEMASVDHAYDGDTAPEISWHSTKSGVEYATAMANALLTCAKIVQDGLWK